MKDPALYLHHIREQIKAVLHNAELGLDGLTHNKTVQSAVLYDLQTMAESAKRVPDDLKEQHPEVAWRDIADFRNIVVHDYLGVDLGVVWEIIRSDLPILQQAVDQMLKGLEQKAREDDLRTQG